LSAQGRLIAAGTRLTELQLDARGAWNLQLVSGIEVRLGRREVEERLNRFIQTALPVMTPRLREVAYVDMRYSNGFSIGWKKPGALARRESAPPVSPTRTPGTRTAARAAA
ncbi:MAG: cell division protein FtsQ/DivIB, partial [Steroidobacteraceae bacterium]